MMPVRSVFRLWITLGKRLEQHRKLEFDKIAQTCEILLKTLI